MPIQKDISGQRFNRLVALRPTINKPVPKWLFQCDCGRQVEARKGNVQSGNTKSCGCHDRERRQNHARELAKKWSRINGQRTGPINVKLATAAAQKVNTKHGLIGTSIYRRWTDMIQRCYNPQNTSYHNYGARGITVCESWREFERFRDWVLSTLGTIEIPKHLTMDRIDVNGNYEPSNMRWATAKEQANNKRYKAPDLSGMRFGNLIAIKVTGRDNSRNQIWLCRCDCGNLTEASGIMLRGGSWKSCG